MRLSEVPSYFVAYCFYFNKRLKNEKKLTNRRMEISLSDAISQIVKRGKGNHLLIEPILLADVSFS